MIAKPAELFDRTDEWADLAEFAAAPSLGATLGLVYGRRRQGKTLLLELLAEATGGFYFAAREQSSALNLAALAQAYARFRGLGLTVAFASWEEAVDALLGLGEGDAPVPVLLDEFPYLLDGAPQLPSVVQAALSPRGRARSASRARLVLCGSAFSIMRELLSGTAPLRGRAPLELLVHPFPYRLAADFWGVADDPELAFRLHALVGGTPAYRDYSIGAAPSSVAELDGWVVRNLLNPSSAFFREGRVLVSEEPGVSDVALYLSVLAVLGSGRTRRGQIAEALGRRDTAIAHPLRVLEDARLIEVQADALRERRSAYRIAEPMLRFHQVVVGPHEPRLARRAGRQVWSEVGVTVSSQIYGPHFERLAREWAETEADVRTVGGVPAKVGRTEVGCAQHGHQHEVDVVVLSAEAGSGSRVTAIGEAKWRSAPVGTGEIDRLRHIRNLLRDQPAGVRMLLFSRSGFTADVQREADAAGDVELVDLHRLYAGS